MEKIKQIRQKDEKALYKEVIELEKKLTNLKFQASFRKLKNVHEITQTRKTIARIWTILNERANDRLQESLK